MGRLARSLRVQLFLWAIMPVTLVLIAISFTGVYAHQRAMRDFVNDRDMAVARLVARLVADGLAQGEVGRDASGLAAWARLETLDVEGVVMILDSQGRVLAHSFPEQAGEDLSAEPGIAEALSQHNGVVTDQGAAHEEGHNLITFTGIVGTDWVVLIDAPVDELVGPILRFPSLVPIIAAGAGFLSLLILAFGWRMIVQPLQQLARATDQVSWGNFQPFEQAPLRDSPQAVQEVRDLHQAMLDMVARIRGYEAGMRDYLGAVTRGQEAERARLARELHDGPVQDLIVLGQRTEMLQRTVERDQKEQVQAALAELRHMSRGTVQQLRRLIGDLRPVYLEDLGLVPALEMLIRQSAARTGAEIRLEKRVSTGRLHPEVELAAYRITQEALNNAIRHAQARHIYVCLSCEGQKLTLTVGDDGIGFQLPRRPDLLTQMGHFGLIGMQERVVRLGGSLRIDTAPGQGTRVVAYLPGQPDECAPPE